MPTSRRSSSQVPVNPAADDAPERPRLTDGEKKANHIASEQKRRHAIREGFDRLSNIVPGLDGQARSEGVVLHGTVDYVKQLMLERRTMIQALEAKGVAVDPEMKKALDALPPGWLDGDPMPIGDGTKSRPQSPEQSQAARSSSSQREGSEAEGGG